MLGWLVPKPVGVVVGLKCESGSAVVEYVEFARPRVRAKIRTQQVGVLETERKKKVFFSLML
jgi:hypothetical protein